MRNLHHFYHHRIITRAGDIPRDIGNPAKWMKCGVPACNHQRGRALLLLVASPGPMAGSAAESTTINKAVARLHGGHGVSSHSRLPH